MKDWRTKTIEHISKAMSTTLGSRGAMLIPSKERKLRSKVLIKLSEVLNDIVESDLKKLQEAIDRKSK